MKPKYYPHLTVAAAVLLTAAPLCFVLSLKASDSAAELDALIAQTEVDPPTAERATSVQPLAIEPSVPEIASAVHEPRVAMSQDRPVSVPRPADPPPVMSDAAAVMDMAMLSDPDEGRLEQSPPPVPVPADARPQEEAAARPAADSMNVTFPALPAVKTLIDGGSHFGATAHLAMRESFGDLGQDSRQHQRLQADAMSGQPAMSHDGADRAANRAAGRLAGPSSDTPMVGGQVVLPEPDGFDQPVQAAREDVILQQPLESRPVSRVENIVAVTKAKGWPVALVRSDLPDDHWWVQQMVGIRGNAFAARANFGNENSIRGSVYHLVFVFLDSPDEVRRFRIAKQFKELPEGIRRSREFTFTRR